MQYTWISAKRKWEGWAPVHQGIERLKSRFAVPTMAEIATQAWRKLLLKLKWRRLRSMCLFKKVTQTGNVSHNDLNRSVCEITASRERLYRILTEWMNVDQVVGLLIARGFDYTIFTGKGAWRGARENSMAIELATVRRDQAASVALSIKEMNKQETVIVQELRYLRCSSNESAPLAMDQSSINYRTVATSEADDIRATVNRFRGGIIDVEISKAQNREDQSLTTPICLKSMCRA